MEGDEGAQGEGAPAAPPVVEVRARSLKEALSGLQDNTVTHVELVGKNIGADGAVAIRVALEHNTSLQHLDLRSNQIGDDGAAAIGAGLEHNTSLQHLDLEGNQIGADGAAAFGAGLKHNTSLQHLDLRSNQIGDDGAAAIGAGLEHNTSLQQLYLNNNQIGDDGAAAIAAGLEHNTALLGLYFSGSKNRIGDAGAAALFVGLEHNATLNRLHLAFYPIPALGTEFLWTSRLKVCTLSFHKVVWPPPSLASQGRSAIYPFLEAVKERSAPLARSRVMFVGAGGSGKTTLKTALLLRGAGSRETLLRLRQSMIETIQVQWTEADLQAWVDTDLAIKPGFFKSCPKARGLNGGDWLQLTAADVARIFDHPDTATSKRVVSKMLAVQGFLKPEATQTAADATASNSWWWWDEMVESLARSTAALEGFDWPEEAKKVPAGANSESPVPYGVLLNIPHVWTEGVELDTRWEEYTLWDFPGQMELYPSHRLFLACETAVYVLVVNGRTGNVVDCMRQLHRWLSLIQSGMRAGGSKVEARIVVTHTDDLSPDHRNALLRDVRDAMLSNYSNHFLFGDRCYATCYRSVTGGDVDTLRTELVRLRSVLPSNRPLPASYQAICNDVVALERDNPRWPVVPISAIDWRGQDEALVCLEDLGFLRRAGDKVILEPVTWLSTLMSAFLHPLHGIGTRSAPRLPEGATAAAMREHHNDSVQVDSATACQIVNLRKKVVDFEHESEVLPLLAHFDICFSPLKDGKYVFPSLLPRVTSLPSWLARTFDGELEGRRYSCIREHDFIPPTVASLLMQRSVAMGRRLGGKPLFFGRGTVVVGYPDRNVIVVYLSDDDRALDVFACGPNRHTYLSGTTAHLASVLAQNYWGHHVAKHRLTRLPSTSLDDAFVEHHCQHPFLGPCQALPVSTDMQNAQGVLAPEWLATEYEVALPEIPSWVTRHETTPRIDYFLRGSTRHTQLLTDPLFVKETWDGMVTHSEGCLPAPTVQSDDRGPLIVVASCPHTMSLTNTPPFRPVDNVNVFDVFAHCEALQRAGRIRIAYDRPNTSNACDRDADVVWSLSDPRLAGKTDKEKWAAVRESVSQSVWFHGFQMTLKTAIKLAAQSDKGRDIRLVCIQGGPITELEQEYMSKIVGEGRRDAAVFGLTDIRVDIAFRTYREFREEFPL